MMAQMVPTGLVIMADRIANNTAYFPLITVEELPRNYNPNRGERVRRKLRLPESWKVSADWCEPGFFERHFGFSANGIQVAAKMETPGILILEAPMEQDKTEAALAAEIWMNRFHLGGAPFFSPLKPFPTPCSPGWPGGPSTSRTPSKSPWSWFATKQNETTIF